MPAAALAIGFAASELGATAAISGALLEAGASAVVADVATGAIIGAGSGAISSAIQGGDIGQGMLIGGVLGGLGAGISGQVTQALGGDTLSAGLQGPVRPPELFGSSSLGAGAVKGITGLATGGLGAAMTGGDPLRGALLGGISGFGSGYLGSELGLGKMGSAALGGALSYGLGQAFGPDAATRQAVSGASAASQPTTTYAPTITGKTSSLQSTAPLGGALLASPTLGYTPGSTFLGGSDKDKPAQNVWNVASLKEGAPVGPSTSDGTSQS